MIVTCVQIIQDEAGHKEETEVISESGLDASKVAADQWMHLVFSF